MTQHNVLEVHTAVEAGIVRKPWVKIMKDHMAPEESIRAAFLR